MLSRPNCTRRTLSIGRAFPGWILAVFTAWTMAGGRAAGAPVHIGLSGGVALFQGQYGRLPGPNISVELRSAVNQYIDGIITLDLNHSRLDHDALIRTDESGSHGANRTLALMALNFGSRLKNHLNLYVGLGGYYAHWTDLVKYYAYEGSQTSEIDSETELFMQVALHVDIIQTRPGNVFVTFRLVHDLASDRHHEIVFFPLTAGFRFH